MKKHNTTIKAFILLLLTAFSFTASAYDFYATASSGQRIYFNILSDSTVSVTYPRFYNNSYYYGFTKPTGNLIIPSTVTQNSQLYHVVSIGANAFYSCTGLTAVSIPSSVTIINDGAFNHCSGLSSLTIPNSVITIGVGAFQSCSNIQSVSLGSSLTIIGNVAFESCTSLHSLTLPNSLTMIGNWAFSNCSSLDSVSIGTSLSQIQYNIFAGCNNIQFLHYNARNATCSYISSDGYHSSLPLSSLQKLIVGDSVQTIHSYTFADATNLDTLSLGTHINTIEQYAFQNCYNVRYLYYNIQNCSDSSFIPNSTSDTTTGFQPFHRLSTLILGDSVLSIPSYAFQSMTQLTNLTLPQNLLSIGNHSFANCPNLSCQLTLPQSLQSIGEYAFQNCTHIGTTLQLPDNLLTIGRNAFQNCDSLFYLYTNNSSAPLTANVFSECNRLYQVSIGNNIHSIGDSAFLNCPRLTNITFGTNISTIGNSAFRNCIRLITPVFPSGLTSISHSAFKGCTALGDEITFPASISNIGDSAFSNTHSIATITMKGSTPPTIYANTFSSSTASTQVLVPCGSLLAYFMSNYWENFSNLHESAPYTITISTNNPTMGSASVTLQPTCSSPIARIQATANTNYHFIQWNDGNTANPRILNLSSDTSFTAIFASDYSYINVICNDSTRGIVSGSGLYSYMTPVTISATAFPDYHFQRWNDGNTQNPRTVYATQDSTFSALFLPNLSTITVNNNNPLMGTVSGSGTYYYQNQIVISATPFTGHHFTFWNDGITTNPRTISVSQDSTFTANFAPNIYTLTAFSNNNSMGTVSGAGSYNYLSQVELTATPNFGHHFNQWSDGVTTNPRTIIITSDTIFSALFAPNTYTVDITSNDTTTGTAYGSGIYNFGTTANISASPAYGYHFVQWSDGNQDNPRSLTVTGNTSLVAFFAINTYTVSLNTNNSTMGSVNGSGIYNHNTPVQISAIPYQGYHFIRWSDNDTNNPRLINVTSNITLTAIFAINTYTLTAISANDAYGTVTGSGTYNYNSTAIILASPFYGYHFLQWNDGNTSNPRTITITSDTGYTAHFAINQYQAHINSNNPLAGTTTGSGTYNYLSTITITATPMPHHHFTQWSDGNTSNPRTLTLTSDTTLTALFVTDTLIVTANAADTTQGHISGAGPTTFGSTVTLLAIPNHGYYFTNWNDGNTSNPRTITITSDTNLTAYFQPYLYSLTTSSSDTTMGTVTGNGIYNYMAHITLTATPRPHHIFTSWNDGNTSNPRTITITSDTILIANFQPEPQYTITVIANDNTQGSVNGSGTYYGGDTATITATPYNHHTFQQWSDGITDNPRTIRVLQNATFTAIFAPQTYTITATSNNNDMGAAFGSGQYAYGSQATLIARPYPGYSFSNWNDGDTNNPRTITVSHNATYQAIFYRNLSIDDIDNPQITVLTQGHQITILGDNASYSRLFDITGRRINASATTDNSATFLIQTSGVYLLQTKNGQTHKIVIR